MDDELIYLDHQATTPVDARVLAVMLPYFTEVYGNAASKDHAFGLDARRAVEIAREQIAAAINAHPDEIIFTSGATESTNLALSGVVAKYGHRGKHIITCQTEHKATLDCCAWLETQGARVTYLPVDEYGLVRLADVEAAITDQTILISIMTANNEIGTIAPVAEIGQLAEQRGVLFHTDAVQALGHIPLDVKAMNIHLMSLSAHKLYGPKGVGALYRRRSNPRVLLSPIIYGGGHEKGLRSGTLNVPGIVGFGQACELATALMADENKVHRGWTEQIFARLNESIDGVRLNGHPTNRLAHNLNVSLPGVESRALIVKLKQVALATGSACTSDKVEPSHVISALGFGIQRAHSAIRISVGRTNTDLKIGRAINDIITSIKAIQVSTF